VESRVILGRKGAEGLERPGLALTFVGGRWERVQTLRVDRDAAQAIVGRVTAPDAEVLEPIERDLVRYALEELDGAFTINRMYERFTDRISKRQLTALGQRWERRGWLTSPADAVSPRYVTDELSTLLPCPRTDEGGDTVTGVTGGDRQHGTVTGVMTGS